jgi:phospholipid/cholesterol/gamma-HCH transport system permease protein
MAIIGGWLITVHRLRVAGSVYWTSVVDTLSIADVWMGLSKPLVLGYVIVSIASHLGLGAQGGTQGVGRATTQAVVAGAVSVIAVDFLMTRLLITIFY